MDEEKQPVVVDRRKRVQRLKKVIIYGLIIGITLPWLLCAILGIMLWRFRQEQKELNGRIISLTELTQTQKDMLDEWQRSVEERLTKREESPEVPVSETAEEQHAEENAQEREKEKEEDAAPAEVIHRVYLTFDDGPSVHTNEILDILKAYDVKATFFVLGKEGEGAKQALKRIVEEGHTVGMHSYSHQYDDVYSSKEAFAADFEKIQDYIFQVTGVTTRLYRFPGGSSNTVTTTDIHEFISYLEEQNAVYFDWNVSSGDAAKISLSSETIAENATRGIENREESVILFHDAAGRETTVEALPIILEKLQGMKNVVILPITEETEAVQHVKGDY